MFTREELRSKLPFLVKKKTLHIEVIQFISDDFPSSSTEESIQICRCLKADIDSALSFWVASQHCLDWNGKEEYLLPYLKGAVCQGLEENEFMLMLNRTQNLKHPVLITPKGKYIWGQKMANEWNDYSMVAEFEKEFIAFNWDTTA